MKEVGMTRSHNDARSPRIALRPIALAVLALVLPLTSCATMFNGMTQLVPVDSRPEHAEVFVNGASMGLTPVDLRLPRHGDVTVEVRLGAQVRSFLLRSETQGAMVGLDLVPVAAAGGMVVLAGYVGTSVFSGTVEPGGYLLGLGLVGASLAPVVIDYGTGAIFRLNPGEIVAVFE
jgi:hypothetical protein